MFNFLNLVNSLLLSHYISIVYLDWIAKYVHIISVNTHFITLNLKFYLNKKWLFNYTRDYHFEVTGKKQALHFLLISFSEEEYKNLVEKYATIREEFQTKMVDSCTVSDDKRFPGY